MASDTEAALGQPAGATVTVLAASLLHLWEETQGLLWKGWAYFLQELKLPIRLKRCPPNSSTAKTPWKKLEAEWEQISGGMEVQETLSTRKYSLMLTVKADVLFLPIWLTLMLHSTAFLFRRKYIYGKKNPSRWQGKFLGAKKSFSIRRKYWAEEIATWTLKLKTLKKAVQVEALNSPSRSISPCRLPPQKLTGVYRYCRRSQRKWPEAGINLTAIINKSDPHIPGINQSKGKTAVGAELLTARWLVWRLANTILGYLRGKSGTLLSQSRKSRERTKNRALRADGSQQTGRSPCSMRWLCPV